MITTSFTDIHGISHDAAVIEVVRVNVNSHSTEVWDKQSGHQVHNNNHYMNLEAQYWPSAESKEAGSIPLNLLAKGGRQLGKSFDSKPDTTDLVALAEAYIVDEVIPEIAGAGASEEPA